MAGTSIMPPSRPLSGRLRSQTRPSRSTRQTMPRLTGLTFFGIFLGYAVWSPDACAAQSGRHGQVPQSGERGVQTVAPRSMIACA